MYRYALIEKLIIRGIATILSFLIFFRVILRCNFITLFMIFRYISIHFIPFQTSSDYDVH